MRFALLEAKMGLAAVIRRYELLPCSRTVDEIVPDPKQMLSGNVGGLWLKSAERKRVESTNL